MSELSKERSEEEAFKLNFLQGALSQLDLEYLQDAYEQMKSSQSYQEAAGVLDPRLFTHNARMDLGREKLRLFKLILEARESFDKIQVLKIEVEGAQSNEQKLSQIFGL